MRIRKFVHLLKYNEDNSLYSVIGSRSKLRLITLKEFICTYQKSLGDYYGEDFGSESEIVVREDGLGSIVILCMVDMGERRYTSPKASAMIRKSGKSRRDRIKHRYSYNNPLNRIYGYLIVKDEINPLIPKEKKVMTLSLICSSPFTDKRGIGSDLMDNLLKYATSAGYTDIILEVANEWAERINQDNESDDESDNESDNESNNESDDDEDDESIWQPSEEVIYILSHEFWRKTMRKPNGIIPYYNINEDYIRDMIEDYLFNIKESTNDEVKTKVISDINDPGDDEYGGYWYRKGKESQKELMNFYEKFGFIEDQNIHLKWGCYSDIPYPTMVCNL